MPQLLFNPVTASLDLVATPTDFSREGIALVGAVNNFNTVFTTPEKFLHEDGGVTIKIYYNGQRLDGGDYTPSESGGSGTGYDTVTLIFTPRDTAKYTDKLTADYHVF